MTSLDQLERQAALQRARFIESMDDVRLSLEQTATKLRENLSPANILHRSSTKWRERALKSIRDNPVRVASVAAFAVYPAWRVARVVPLPMVVAGLGVLFAAKMRSAPASVDRVVTKTNQLAKEVAATVADVTAHVQDTATGRLSAAGATVQDVSRTMTEAAGSRLSAAVDATGGAISDVKEAVRPPDETLQVMKDGAQAVAASAADLGSRAAASGSYYSRDAIASLSKKPVLVATMGIAVGSLLAALLPEKSGNETVQACTETETSRAAKMRMPK